MPLAFACVESNLDCIFTYEHAAVLKEGALFFMFLSWNVH